MSDLEPSVTHAAAIAALATSRLAALGSALTVYVDEVPADDDPDHQVQWPYVVFWTMPGSPVPEAERLAGWGGDVTSTVQATVAGLTRADVIGGVDRLIKALHRRKPVLPGRMPGDIEHAGGSGPVPDPDPVPALGGRPAWTAAVFFALQSSPSNTS